MSAGWFRDLRFGIFVHWGIYSIAGKGEWLMMLENWSTDEYKDAFLHQFNPRKDCVRDWVRAAKSAGAEYMVFTTRHHDGFCLYDSRASIGGFTSIYSPAQHDFVADYVNECRNAGLRVGLYYSLADWRIDSHSKGALIEANMEMLRTQAREQVRELMTNYGKIDILWYDGAFGYDEKGIMWDKEWPDWHAEALNSMVRELQPDIVINNRSGTPEDFSTPEQHIVPEADNRMWEACMTMNDTWGYHLWDYHWKSTGDLIDNIARCSIDGGNYLLNIGPVADGSVPGASRERCAKIGRWVRQYGSLLRGAHRTTVFSFNYIARKDNTIYVFLRNWPGTSLRLRGIQAKAVSAEMVGSDTSVGVRQVGDLVYLSQIPDVPEDDYFSVVAIHVLPE